MHHFSQKNSKSKTLIYFRENKLVVNGEGRRSNCRHYGADRYGLVRTLSSAVIRRSVTRSLCKNPYMPEALMTSDMHLEVCRKISIVC